MLRRSLLVSAALLGAWGACYQDDSAGPQARGPLARVLLTDAPFPYDSVQSVNVHVVSIEANAVPDTSGGGEWVTIARPDRLFDLLQLQQGATAVLGEGALPAGQYQAVRMLVDAGRSSVRWSGDLAMTVQWPFPGGGVIPFFALVEAPLAVSDEGAEIVIDFDLARTFRYDLFGTREFTVLPWLRAVNTAATGAIEGTITSDLSGAVAPLRNANVTVYQGDPAYPATWGIVAGGRSGADGRYRVAFLREGAYIVQIEHPLFPILAPVVRSGVAVTRGATRDVSALLAAGGSGGAYLRISGPTLVGVGGSITLVAAVGDAAGDAVPQPAVTWTASDDEVLSVVGASDTATVTGLREGSATVFATSGELTGSIDIEVVGELAPVASVTIVPSAWTAGVGDSLGFRAELRDADGSLLGGRPLSWFSSDAAVAGIEAVFGAYAVVRARASGTATLRATSEGKAGEATITVP
jgi:hypothetical protein